MNIQETTRELNATELEQVAGSFVAPSGCRYMGFVPDGIFSTTGTTYYSCSWGTLGVSNNPTD